MTSPILFAGGEDLSFSPFGGEYGGSILPDTTAGRFRSGYARHALSVRSDASGAINLHGIRSQPFAPPLLNSGAELTPFWITARVWCLQDNIFGITSDCILLRLLDDQGVPRLVISNKGGFATSPIGTPGGPYQVFTAGIGAGGIINQSNGLTGSLSGLSPTPLLPDKLDIYVSYNVLSPSVAPPGQITIYVNGTQIFDSGHINLTTNSNVKIAYLDLMSPVELVFNGTTLTAWSEVIVSTRDTRTMGMLTQVASGNGNTHNWDHASAANMDSALSMDSSPESSATAGQIDEYTVTPGAPPGSFGIVSVVQHARASAGSSGPQKIKQIVRTGGTDYFSADKTLSSAWTLYVENWDTNPNTGVEWQTSDLPPGSSAFNMGVKSDT